jgi:hypothetical protein
VLPRLRARNGTPRVKLDDAADALAIHEKPGRVTPVTTVQRLPSTSIALPITSGSAL